MKEFAAALITGDRGDDELPAEEPFRVISATVVTELMARHMRNSGERPLECSTSQLYARVMAEVQRVAGWRRQSAQRQEALDQIKRIERQEKDKPLAVWEREYLWWVACARN